MCLWGFFQKRLAFESVDWIWNIFPHQCEWTPFNPLRIRIKQKGGRRTNCLLQLEHMSFPVFRQWGFWFLNLCVLGFRAGTLLGSWVFGLGLGVAPFTPWFSGLQNRPESFHQPSWFASLQIKKHGSPQPHEPIIIRNLFIVIYIYLFDAISVTMSN